MKLWRGLSKSKRIPFWTCRIQDNRGDANDGDGGDLIITSKLVIEAAAGRMMDVLLVILRTSFKVFY
jgi:hypothetical protein